MTIQVLPAPAELAHAVAQDFVTQAEAAIAARGRFTIALTGGTTPREAYQVLGTEPYAERVDWAQVLVFWGDERCVPPDHADSNFRMAREALLSRVPIPSANVHRMRGEDQPRAAAAAYEKLIAEIVGPRFDLVHLGMGTDAHIASLFPNSAALSESERRVCAQFAKHLDMWRITMTPVLINDAARVTFIVAGAAKAAAVATVLEGAHAPRQTPAQIVAPHTGDVLWLLDRAAARDLERST